jgi:sialic acid synthase SpsE
MLAVEKLWNRLRSGKPYFIAEAGVNHLGSFELAERLIAEAAKAGAHAIKFQSYKAKNLCTKDAPRFWDWDGEVEKAGSQYDSYSLLDSFGAKEHAVLRDMCVSHGIDFMSTPFDNEATDYLDDLGVLAYKIASCDITNYDLLDHVGKKKKIVMLSTGASNLEEIEGAIKVLKNAGTDKIVVMHCNLKYPTDRSEINLSMIHSLRKKFGDDYVYGLSDHTRETQTPSFSVALGANVVEKHYTVDKTLGKSADHWLSVDPSEVAEIVDSMDMAYVMMGSLGQDKSATDSEIRAKKFARRSLVSLRKIEKGETISRENMACKRPGTGISASEFFNYIGKKATRTIEDDCLLTEEDFK